VELSTGQFTLGHGTKTNSSNTDEKLGTAHQLCIVDQYGSIVQTFGETWGRVVDELSDPHCITRDSKDQIVVGDRLYCRLGLFSSLLSHQGEIQRLDDLYESFVCILSAVHWDETTGRLYIGDLEGFVYVLGARQSCG